MARRPRKYLADSVYAEVQRTVEVARAAIDADKDGEHRAGNGDVRVLAASHLCTPVVHRGPAVVHKGVAVRAHSPFGVARTSTGASRRSVVPSPSWPCVLSPQHQTRRSASRAQPWS